MMTTLSTVASANRDVSAKMIDFRIDSNCRAIECRLIVGDQNLQVSIIELAKLAEIIVSYIEPEKLVVSPDYARELQPVLQRIIEKDCMMQEILARHGKQKERKEH